VGTADWIIAGMVDGETTSFKVSNLTAPANYEGRVREFVADIPSAPQVLGPVALLPPDIDYGDVGGGPDPNATVGDNIFSNPRFKDNAANWNLA
jgi:hypothetical protein